MIVGPACVEAERFGTLNESQNFAPFVQEYRSDSEPGPAKTRCYPRVHRLVAWCASETQLDSSSKVP